MKESWQKKAPDKEGYWIRINVVNIPEIHWIQDIEGTLHIFWGWGGEQKLVEVKEIVNKLEHFYWIKLEELPNEITRQRLKRYTPSNKSPKNAHKRAN